MGKNLLMPKIACLLNVLRPPLEQLRLPKEDACSSLKIITLINLQWPLMKLAGKQ